MTENVDGIERTPEQEEEHRTKYTRRVHDARHVIGTPEGGLDPELIYDVKISMAYWANQASRQKDRKDCLEVRNLVKSGELEVDESDEETTSMIGYGGKVTRWSQRTNRN